MNRTLLMAALATIATFKGVSPVRYEGKHPALALPYKLEQKEYKHPFLEPINLDQQ